MKFAVVEDREAQKPTDPPEEKRPIPIRAGTPVPQPPISPFLSGHSRPAHSPSKTHSVITPTGTWQQQQQQQQQQQVNQQQINQHTAYGSPPLHGALSQQVPVSPTRRPPGRQGGLHSGYGSGASINSAGSGGSGGSSSGRNNSGNPHAQPLTSITSPSIRPRGAPSLGSPSGAVTLPSLGEVTDIVVVGDESVISNTVHMSGAVFGGRTFSYCPASEELSETLFGLITENIVYTFMLGEPLAESPTAGSLCISRTGSALYSFCTNELGLTLEDVVESKRAFDYMVTAETPSRPRALAGVVIGITPDGGPLVRVYMRGLTAYVTGACTHLVMTDGEVTKISDEARRGLARADVEGMGWSCALAYKDFPLENGMSIEVDRLDESGFVLTAVFSFAVPVRKSCSILAFRCKNLGVRLHLCSESDIRIAGVIASKMGLVGPVRWSSDLPDLDPTELTSLTCLATCSKEDASLYVGRLREIKDTVVMGLSMNDAYSLALASANFSVIQALPPYIGSEPGMPVIRGFRFEFSKVGGFVDVFSVVEAIQHSKTRSAHKTGSFLPIKEESSPLSVTSHGSQRIVPSWNRPSKQQVSAGGHSAGGVSFATATTHSNHNSAHLSPSAQSPWGSPAYIQPAQALLPSPYQNLASIGDHQNGSPSPKILHNAAVRHNAINSSTGSSSSK
jgi:hypothetical protein